MRVLLHDHLDGGLRPSTALELARELDVPLPPDVRDVEDLDSWFDVRRGLPIDEAFRRFELPIAVLQDKPALRRVAREACADLHQDGVRYAELRFAPLQHMRGGLSGDEVVEAVLSGLLDRTDIAVRLILCAMRTEAQTDDVVTLANHWRSEGVVGVDLAGPEVGFPAEAHRTAFLRANRLGLGVTIHAGEMDGLASVAAAVLECGADRLGHGWWVIEDCVVRDGAIVDVGPVAGAILERTTPLELCITSNLCLGMSIEAHPFMMLHHAGFKVTLNTDDRTITRCTLSSEIELARRAGASDEAINQMEAAAVVAAFDRSAASKAIAQ